MLMCCILVAGLHCCQVARFVMNQSPIVVRAESPELVLVGQGSYSQCSVYPIRILLLLCYFNSEEHRFIAFVVTN